MSPAFLRLRRRVCRGHEKTLAVPARVLVGSGSEPLGPFPPSISPPGAGNEYEYALNAELDRAKNAEEGYVDQAEVVLGHLHAPTVRPNHDGDVSAVAGVEQTHLVLHAADRPVLDRRCWASVPVMVKRCGA